MKTKGRIVGFDVQGTVPWVCHVLTNRQRSKRPDVEREDYIRESTNIIYVMRRKRTDRNRYADPDPDRFRTSAGLHRFVLSTGDLYKGPVTL